LTQQRDGDRPPEHQQRVPKRRRHPALKRLQRERDRRTRRGLPLPRDVRADVLHLGIGLRPVDAGPQARQDGVVLTFSLAGRARPERGPEVGFRAALETSGHHSDNRRSLAADDQCRADD
jgi:hypothetical protein